MNPKKQFSWTEFIVGAIASVIFGAAIAVLLMEWMVGCGEYYIDSNGKKHANECLFLNIERKL